MPSNYISLVGDPNRTLLETNWTKILRFVYYNGLNLYVHGNLYYCTSYVSTQEQLDLILCKVAINNYQCNYTVFKP